eukprot:812772_1
MPGESSITDEKNDSALKQLDNQLQEVRSKLSRSTQENQHLRDQIAQLKKEHKYALNTQREDSDRNILVLEDEKEELNAKNCEMSAELDELRSKNEELRKIIKEPISEDVELRSVTSSAGSVSGSETTSNASQHDTPTSKSGRHSRANGRPMTAEERIGHMSVRMRALADEKELACGQRDLLIQRLQTKSFDFEQCQADLHRCERELQLTRQRLEDPEMHKKLSEAEKNVTDYEKKVRKGSEAPDGKVDLPRSSHRTHRSSSRAKESHESHHKRNDTKVSKRDRSNNVRRDGSKRDGATGPLRSGQRSQAAHKTSDANLHSSSSGTDGPDLEHPQESVTWCIPTYARQHVMGPQAKTIRDIEAESGCQRVRLEILPCAADFQKEMLGVNLCGTRANIDRAIQLIQARVDEVKCVKWETPASSIGHLIGAKGENVIRIRSNTNCNITIPPHNIQNRRLGDEPVTVTISGLDDNVKRAIEMLEERREERRESLVNPTVSEWKTPASSIPCLIGPGGECIKRIQSKTSCKIKMLPFHRRSVGDEPVTVTISGLDDNVKRAIEMLEERRESLEKSKVSEWKTPASSIPCLIGSNGEYIKRIRHQSNCTITIPTKTEHGAHGDEPVTVIIGGEDYDAINRAIQMLEERRKTSWHSRASAHSGPDSDSLLPPTTKAPRFSDYSRSPTSSQRPVDRNRSTRLPRPSPKSDRGRESDSSVFSDGTSTDHSVTELEEPVVFPIEVRNIGHISGQKGCYLKLIEMYSKCRIHVPGKGERSSSATHTQVTVTPLELSAEVQLARTLIDDFMAFRPLSGINPTRKIKGTLDQMRKFTPAVLSQIQSRARCYIVIPKESQDARAARTEQLFLHLYCVEKHASTAFGMIKKIMG